MAEELVPREEVRDALEARRELGADYEAEIAERLAQRIEARLGERPVPERSGLTNEQQTGIAIVSIIATIPLIAIASGSGVAAIVAVCAALVLVNLIVRR